MMSVLEIPGLQESRREFSVFYEVCAVENIFQALSLIQA